MEDEGFEVTDYSDQLAPCKNMNTFSIAFMTENDNQGLYWYFEKVYKVTANGKISSAKNMEKTGGFSSVFGVFLRLAVCCTVFYKPA